MEIATGGQCVPEKSLGSREITPTIEDRLLQRKNRLEADLHDVNVALEALQANPEINKVLCLISKVGY